MTAKAPYVPKVGEWYRLDRHGRPQRYTTWRAWLEWLPWVAMLLATLAVLVGLTLWLGLIVPIVVGLYLLLGLVWLAWSLVASPETLDEAAHGWFHWHPERIRLITRTDVFGMLLFMLPTWPLWASGMVVI